MLKLNAIRAFSDKVRSAQVSPQRGTFQMTASEAKALMYEIEQLLMHALELETAKTTDQPTQVEIQSSRF